MWLNPDVAVTLPFSFLYKDEVFRLYDVFIAFLFISIWKYLFFQVHILCLWENSDKSQANSHGTDRNLLTMCESWMNFDDISIVLNLNNVIFHKLGLFLESCYSGHRLTSFSVKIIKKPKDCRYT